MKSSYLRLQYQKLQKRIGRINFHQLSQRKQEQLQRRLMRCEQQIYNLASSSSILKRQVLKTSVVGLGMLATIPATAQTFTEITTPASPFTYLPIDPIMPYGMPIAYSAVLSFVDIDDDGDFDAFVGQSNGSISFVENIGSASMPNFSLSSSSEPFGLSNVGRRSAPALIDIDGDGDLDAFIGEEDGNINYFENIGSSSIPNFSLSSSSEPFGISSVSKFSAPTFVDIDADGDQDAFVAEGKTTISYYENIGSTNNPIFELSTDNTPFDFTSNFSKTIPSFIDIDKDGDFDALIGAGLSEIRYYENIGSASSASFGFSFVSQPFGLIGLDFRPAPSFVDIDADGDADVFVGETYNINYYENTSTDSSIPAFQYPVVDVGRWAAPSFADIDADGDLDGFIGERDSYINYFKNIGSNECPNFEVSSETAPFGLLNFYYYAAPSIVDIDDDGDLDIFNGTSNGTISYYENIGSNSSPEFSLSSSSEPFGITDIGFVSSPSFVDIDGDGDFDVFVGEPLDGISYFENVGSASSPNFSLSSSSEPFGLADVSYGYYTPSFVDIDSDGDFDAFVGNLYGTVDYYKNIGSASSANFSLSTSSEPFGLTDVGRQSNPIILDIDGDGLLEAVIGNFLGNLNYFESNISSNERIECEEDDIMLGSSMISSGDYNAKSTLTSESTIETGSLVRFTAGNNITLSNDFRVENGATFTAKIVACFPDDSANFRENEIFVDTKPAAQDISIAPNPTAGATTLQFNLPSTTTMQVAVYNGMGQLVEILADKQSYDVGSNSIELLTDNYEDGVYWIVLESEAAHKTLRLLVFKK